MAGLFYSVGADFDKLEKLQKEIVDLKTTLEGMDRAADSKTYDKLNKELSKTSKEAEDLGRKLAPVLPLFKDIETQAAQTAAALGKSIASDDINSKIEIHKQIVASLEDQYKKVQASLDAIDYDSDDAGMAQSQKTREILSQINTELEEQRTNLGFLEIAQKKAATTTKAVAKEVQEVAQKSKDASMGLVSMYDMPTTGEQFKESINAQRTQIKSLEIQAVQTKDALANLKPNRLNNKTTEKNYNDLIAKQADLRDSISAERKALTQLENDYKKLQREQENEIKTKEKQKLAQEKASTATVTYMTQIRKVKEEMVSLELQGKKESDRYKKLEIDLARIGTAYRKVLQSQKLLTTPGNANLTGIIQGMTGFAGAFSAVQGVSSLFVKDTEKLAAIQTKLQAAMSMTIGLQQVSNVLHSTSAFRIHTVAKANKLWRDSQVLLNRQLGVSIALSKALMIGGVGLLLVGIAALTYKYKSLNKEQDKAAKRAEDINSVYKEAQKTVNKQKIELDSYLKVLNSEVATIDKKKRAIEAIKAIVPGYNAELDETGKLIKSNTRAIESYIEAIKKQATAEAAKEKMQEVANKRGNAVLDKELKKKELEKLKAEREDKNFRKQKETKGVFGVKGVESPSAVAGRVNYNLEMEKQIKASIARIDENIDELDRTYGDYDDILKKYADALFPEKEFTKNSKQYWNNIREEQQKEMDSLMPDSKEFAAAKKKRDNAEKMLEAWSKTNHGKEDSTEKKKKKELQDQADLLTKITNEKAKAELNARNEELENQQKRLDLEKDSFDKQQKQLELNHQKDILNIDRRVQERIEAQQKAEKDQWKKEGEKGIFVPKTRSVLDLSSNDQSAVEDSEYLANETRKKATQDLLKALLDKYQNYNAQRIELEKQFSADETALNQKRTAENGAEIDAALAELSKKRKESLSAIDTKELQENLDWDAVFGNLDKVSTDALIDVRNKLKEYISNSIDTISKEDLKVLSDAFENLNDKIANRQPITELKDGYIEYKKACEDVVKAQKKVNDIIAAGNGGSKEAKDATKELNDAQKKRRESLVKMTSSVNDMGQKGGELVNSGQELVGMLTNLGVEVPESIGNALDGLGQVMGGLEKIDFTKPFSIISGGVSILSGIGNTIAGIFGGNGSEISQERFDQYENLISTMGDLIAKQVEMLNAMAGQQAVAQTEKAIALINKQAEAARNMGDEFLNSGAKWNKRSHGVRLQRELKGYADEFNRIGINFSSLGGRMTGLFDLSSDQLQLLKKEIPEAWAKMDENTRSYLQTIIDSGEELENLKEKLNEALTAVSFDSVKSSLNSFLLDADATMEDVANNFEDYMRNAITNIITNSLLAEELEGWYQSFANAMKDDQLTASEKDALKKEYEEIYNNAMKMRDELFDIANIDPVKKDVSQTASSRSLTGMSQDLGMELNGRATDMQMSLHRIIDAIIQENPTDAALITQTLIISDTVKKVMQQVSESKEILMNSYFELKDINKNTQELYGVHARLESIDKKLDRL